MSTITGTTTAPAQPALRPETRPAPTSTSAPAATAQDSTSLSSEATSPSPAGSVPSFARPIPTRDLPHQLPRTETPEQKKAREARQLRETDELRRRLDRRWQGGIMQGGPRPRPPESSTLPHQIPHIAETPEQKQARRDRECAEMRELERRQRRRFRPIANS